MSKIESNTHTKDIYLCTMEKKTEKRIAQQPAAFIIEKIVKTHEYTHKQGRETRVFSFSLNIHTYLLINHQVFHGKQKMTKEIIFE